MILLMWERSSTTIHCSLVIVEYGWQKLACLIIVTLESNDLTEFLKVKSGKCSRITSR